MRDPDVNLEDISYDGILDDSQMKGGLGQLVDGLYGDDDYQKQLQGENSGKFCCFSYRKISTLKFKAAFKTNKKATLLFYLFPQRRVRFVSISYAGP